MQLLNFDGSHIDASTQEKMRELLPSAKDALDNIINKNCVGSEYTGWFNWPKHGGFDLVSQLQDFKDSFDTYYDLILVIGVGGSYVGTKAIAESLGHQYVTTLSQYPDHAKECKKPFTPIVYAGQHLSETSLIQLLELLDKFQPIINVISKTGTTIEPMVTFRILRKYMENRYGYKEAQKRTLVTTDEQSGALRSIAKDKNYSAFPVPSDIGGRFSVLTAVGLLPLTLAGYNTEELMAGANQLFSELLMPMGGTKVHPTAQYAAFRKISWETGKRIEILAYHEPQLSALIEWWKQLYGESEGKNRQGLYPAGHCYTTDLHSLGQYAQDGCRNLIETFLTIKNPNRSNLAGLENRIRIPHIENNDDGLGYLENRYLSEINQSAMEATKMAHLEGGVPCAEIRLQTLDERNIGYLIAFFEVSCSISALLMGVNPFDQPGVEQYKKNLFSILGRG